LEANLARVESKLDTFNEKIDVRFTRTGEYILEKFEEVQRELQLINKTMSDGYVNRREYSERHSELQGQVLELQKQYHAAVIGYQRDREQDQKDRKEDASKVNMALLASGLYFIGSLVLHFLPNFILPGVK